MLDTPVMTTDDYARAERFLARNVKKRIFLGEVTPHWLEGDRFWYRREAPGQKTFWLVDPAQRSRTPLFDHQRLAASLSLATGSEYSPVDLPFDSIDLNEETGQMSFDLDTDRWTCSLETYQCRREEKPEGANESELLSPDGKWAALVREHDLFVRDTKTGEERRLTDDGEPLNDYASSPEGRTSTVTERVTDMPGKPVAVWSPDSRRLVSHRLDQWEVESLHLVQAAPPEGRRPVLHSYRYAFPGDEKVPMAAMTIFDLESRTAVPVDRPPRPATFRTPIEWGEVWWSQDGQVLYCIEVERDLRSLKVLAIDGTTGQPREILSEQGQTSIYPRLTMVTPLNVRSLDNGDLIWYSTRDGWGHLYRFDSEGNQVAQLTSGPWTVQEILHVDQEAGVLYCTAGGREPDRDPYLRHLYRVNLDGSGVTLLTPEDADHTVTFSPSGDYFVDRFSRVDTAPVTVLRSSQGETILPLETADISALIGEGWQRPERFTFKARDGVADLYGVLLRPSTFDAGDTYPVIDHIYPGPQTIRAPKSFDQLWQQNVQSTAELGFVLVMLDGLGTPGRSKEFLDLSYGQNFGEAGGLADHVAGIRQLGERYPYLDMDRVGIYGLSGGGYASTRAMLTFPDFFKVAVSMAGNHDQRGYIAGWGETYLGLEAENYARQGNPELAANLRGKLFLMHGEMDDNVHPSLTLQMVDALIAANKDFDLLILPNCNHGLVDVRLGKEVMKDPAGHVNAYATRRLWDYFVRHLLGLEPPAGYAIDN